MVLQGEEILRDQKYFCIKFPVSQDQKTQGAIKTSIQLVNRSRKVTDTKNSVELKEMQKEIEMLQITVNDLKNKFEELDHYRRKSSSLYESLSNLVSEESKSSTVIDETAIYTADQNTKCPFIQYVYMTNIDGFVDLFEKFQKMCSGNNIKINIKDIDHALGEELSPVIFAKKIVEINEEVGKLMEEINIREESQREDANRKPIITDPDDAIWKPRFVSFL